MPLLGDVDGSGHYADRFPGLPGDEVRSHVSGKLCPVAPPAGQFSGVPAPLGKCPENLPDLLRVRPELGDVVSADLMGIDEPPHIHERLVCVGQVSIEISDTDSGERGFHRHISDQELSLGLLSLRYIGVCSCDPERRPIRIPPDHLEPAQ